VKVGPMVSKFKWDTHTHTHTHSMMIS